MSISLFIPWSYAKFRCIPCFNPQHYRRLSIYHRHMLADFNEKNLAIQLIDRFVIT
jgi:hypothetical protein